jgi:hypothetical protein
MYALGSKTQPAAPELVLITRVGSLWPFSSEEIDELVRRYEADGAFAPVRSGPLYAFERR